jgi:hypothetical protein
VVSSIDHVALSSKGSREQRPRRARRERPSSLGGLRRLERKAATVSR